MPSAYPETGRSAWVVSQRGPRGNPHPHQPHGYFLEEERSAAGEVIISAGILLTSKECAWRCLHCDLWKNTTTTRVPEGAIPQQIDYALARLGRDARQVKLYNSGSFFDPAAVPLTDYEAIATRVGFAHNIVVESHPRLVGRQALRFRDMLSGRLEVALGLETSNAATLKKLNKGFDLSHYETASEFLRKSGIAVRAFVLVKPPFVETEEEAIEWAARSAQYACGWGASVISLIPMRGGNGAIERLIAAGEYALPKLRTLEVAQESALERTSARVFADTWDLAQFSQCAACYPQRLRRIHEMNLTQKVLPRVRCFECD